MIRIKRGVGVDVKTCRFIIQLKTCNFVMQECMSFFINKKNREISVQYKQKYSIARIYKMLLIYFCSESGKWSPGDFCGLFCKSRTEEEYSFDIS